MMSKKYPTILIQLEIFIVLVDKGNILIFEYGTSEVFLK